MTRYPNDEPATALRERIGAAQAEQPQKIAFMQNRLFKRWAAPLVLFLLSGALQARELTVMTWNLGWHMDGALFNQWLDACSGRFVRDRNDGLWKPNPNGPATGWQLKWGRDAPIQWDIARLPPCDVYQENRRIVPPTAAAYAKRRHQLAEVIQRQAPDVIAFQEVSGTAAVLEILPDGGRDYQVCSYEGYSVQRLAFAWRRTLGDAAEPCVAYAPLSLPARPPEDRPRPGLTLGLRVDGQLLRFLNLHLKSGCVSPLESADPNGRGQLAGDNSPCLVLQEQLQPLEAWLEQQSQGADRLMMLGDFNRNLAQEAERPPSEAVRPVGNATDPYRPGVRSSNLWRELNDGQPSASKLALVPIRCPGLSASLCEAAKTRRLTEDETNALRNPAALGCRNPVGLDGVAISGTATASAEKVPLGRFGRTRAADRTHPDPLLAVSDHCPLVARWTF
ncbi:MAG: endonuclease/exonuclease/phosphatase family protein [Candidatus Competibacteraceae bacterium]|nr:endonuclease/exonuclease/phosphatase family protein [Candidatus Competibacteraceae bacterium]